MGLIGVEVELGVVVAVAVDDDEDDACSLSPAKAALMAEKKVMRVAVNFIMHTKFYDAVVVLSIIQRLACTVSSGRERESLVPHSLSGS